MKTHLDVSDYMGPILTRCGNTRSSVSRVKDRSRVDCSLCLKGAEIDDRDVALGHPLNWLQRVK
jgi:hypothetical protein